MILYRSRHAEHNLFGLFERLAGQMRYNSKSRMQECTVRGGIFWSRECRRGAAAGRSDDEHAGRMWPCTGSRVTKRASQDCPDAARSWSGCECSWWRAWQCAAGSGLKRSRSCRSVAPRGEKRRREYMGGDMDSALEVAAQNGYDDIVQLLLVNRAPVGDSV